MSQSTLLRSSLESGAAPKDLSLADSQSDREARLIGHILGVIDRGWIFVHRSKDEASFRALINELATVNKSGDLEVRIADYQDLLQRMVALGWDHVHTLASSRAVKQIFTAARAECDAHPLGTQDSVSSTPSV